MTARTTADSMLVAFDADDTLWHNERMFTDTQERFRELLLRYCDEEVIEQRLYETEIRNLSHYGYGVKAFTLSMVETALDLTQGAVSGTEVRSILALGQEMLRAPVELLDGVAEVIPRLASRYRLMVITKGDLMDQETKVARSGLGDYFDYVEVVSRKDRDTYERVLNTHGGDPASFVMVGNSVRSDILPVAEMGAVAVHIPYHTTWVHEEVTDEALDGVPFTRLDTIAEVPAFLRGLSGDA
ncbi:MAG: HAD family hydrolase [Gemmatimonadota bacterium]